MSKNKKHKNTKHGKARISSRMNISKRRADSMAKFAFSKGATHAETAGPLKSYINSLFLRYSYDKSATDFRIYLDFIFIFKNGKLVTSWELPGEYKKREYIKESGFKDGKKPLKANTNPEGIPYKEKEPKFFDSEKSIIEFNKQIQTKKEEKKNKKQDIPSPVPDILYIENFEEAINKLKEKLNEIKVNSVEDLDEEILKINNSHKYGENEKIALKNGLIRRFYQEYWEEHEKNHKEIMKMFSYGLFFEEHCFSNTAIQEEIEEELKFLAQNYVRDVLYKQVLKTNPSLLFKPTDALGRIQGEINFFKRQINTENPNEVIDVLRNLVVINYKNNLYKFSFIELLPNSFNELKKKSMFYFAINPDADIKILNKCIQFSNTKKVTKKLTEALINENSYAKRALKNVVVLHDYPLYNQEELTALVSAMTKFYLCHNYGRSFGIYTRLTNRCCYMNKPVFLNKTTGISRETCYKDWCHGMVDAFIKESILTKSQIKLSELRKIIDKNREKDFKKFEISTKDIKNRKKYIEKELNLYDLQMEAFILSHLPNTVLPKVDFPIQPPTLGGEQ